ncbi:hypothetical protein [Paenibacillus hamazuiensis]|uniref:hypothetical protein n=1 Tax=Paenibacillus hamazuiensis TaxID=2936508 RepID=UPI00200F39E4|nr:hypothetical protein [Paenibacillus hamazuiensis]
MKKKLILLFAAVLFCLQLKVAEAIPEPSKLSTVITLLEETPIYTAPDETIEPIGALAPQNLQVIGAEGNWLTFQKDTDKKWFKVQTWMGADQWIHLELRRMGFIQKTDMGIWLSKETRLNDSPFSDSATELALSPQTVRIVARYQNKFQSSYLAETWAGEKWLIDAENHSFPVTIVNEQIALSTTTSKFDLPVPYDGDNGVLQPQIVTSFEKYNDWYHVRTASGEETWINKKFSEPENIHRTDESVEFHTVTPLRKYPNVYENQYGRYCSSNGESL